MRSALCVRNYEFALFNISSCNDSVVKRHSKLFDRLH